MIWVVWFHIQIWWLVVWFAERLVYMFQQIEFNVQVICYLSNWFHCNFQIFATKDLFWLLLDIYFDNSTASFSLHYGKVPQFTFSKIRGFPLFNLWRILRPTNSHTPLFNVYYMLGHCTARENKQKISQYLFGSMYTTLKKSGILKTSKQWTVVSLSFCASRFYWVCAIPCHSST